MNPMIKITWLQWLCNCSESRSDTSLF